MKQKKSSISKRLKEFRIESLNNRTNAELWANEKLLKYFSKCEFQLEFIYGFRRFDFFFTRVKIALEIDDESHNTPEQKEKDNNSDLVMQVKGITVLRCNNFDEITLNKHILLIDEKIKSKIAKKKAIMIDRSNVTTKIERRKIRNEKRDLKKLTISDKKAKAINKIIKESQLPLSQKPIFIRRRPAPVGIHDSLKFKSNADRERFMQEQLERALKK